MKSKLLLLLAAAGLFSFSFKEPVAYKWYDKNGKPADWAHVVRYCSSKQVVFFGEQHDNAISHWLQLQLAKSLFEADTNLTIGAEMFEADQQLILDEYLDGVIAEKNFEAEMRLWKNHKTDYKPVLDFALEHQLPVIATNVPRRYASLVAKKGPEALMNLPAEAKRYICPLPYQADTSLSGYRNMLQMDMGHGSSMNMVYAQALKDATMAHFIQKNLEEHGRFLHLNGAYHSDRFEGIIHYLGLYNPKATVASITTVLQENVTTLADEHKGKADFILVVDETMTKTY